MMKANNALIGKVNKGGRTDRQFPGSCLAFQVVRVGQNLDPKVPVERGKGLQG